MAARRRLMASRLAPLFTGDAPRAWPLVILSNATSLMGSSVITSALGVVFWWLAARQFSPEAVGLSAAALSASMFLGTLAVLGFGTLLITELPRVSRLEQGVLVSTGLMFTGALGLVLGAALAVLGPRLLGDFRALPLNAVTVAWFALFVGGMPVSLILDQVLIGRLRSELQLVRNTAFAAGKLVFLELAALLTLPHDALTIFATWSLANLVSLGLIVRLPQTRGVLSLGRPRRALLRRLGGAALGHHALNLSVQLPSMLLPVLVTTLLSATANAYFYTAWMVAGVAFLPQTSLATTLFAIGVREPEVLVSRARLTLLLSAIAAVSVCILVAVGGDLILMVFGHQYAEQAGLILRLLSLAAVPLVIKNHYIAFLRIKRRILLGAVVVAGGALLELAGAAVGARLGDTPGLSIGWVLALTIEALCMLPSVWRTLELSRFFLALWPRLAVRA